jgi:hypothetical protein
MLCSLFAIPALAYENLVGEYTGKIIGVVGYNSNVGDPCTVMVGKSDMYGGSLIFEIRDTGKILMEIWNVRNALEQNLDTVKMSTPGTVGRPAEGVVISRGSNGAMQSLKLMFKGGRRGHDRAVNCGNLSKT